MNRKFDFGNLFWGLLLLFIGSMFLLDNLNIVDFQFSNLWRLWPLLIVAAGVSLLSLKGWLGIIVTGALVVLMIGTVVLVSLGHLRPGSNVAVNTQNIEVARTGQNVTALNVEISGGAGNINLSTGADSDLVKAKLESNFIKLREESSQKDGTQSTKLTLDSSKNWWLSNFRNDLSVAINEELPVELKIDAGASKISADLSKLLLRNLHLNAGASEASFKIGNRSQVTEIDLDMGASSIELLVPKDSGVALNIDAGLSNQELPELRKISDDRYESANYATAKNKINVRGSIGMTNLGIRYY